MDKQTWNTKVAEYKPAFGGFLQSYEWGEFQIAAGREVERILEQVNGHEIVAQAIKMDLPAGQFYWYVPKGPLGNIEPEEKIRILRESLPDGMFFRIEPVEGDRALQVKDVQPSTTTMVDLQQTEDEIWSAMKSKTRYNVKLGERKNVECRFVGMEYFDDFIRLMEQTTTRDQFKAHPVSYYKTMLDAGVARLAMAFYKDHAVAANIVNDFAGTRTYLHGATSNLHRNVMAQYTLHAFLIFDAKQQGMQLFDFWGIAPDDADEKHPWYGITRYKRGYGGQVVQMPGTFDIPIQHLWYSAYKLIKKFK